ncbi:bifunctional phosphoribosyl-AMP cyclohydrolase/phosphoribosyl-ATP diphosphatase HisIE [Ruminococcaceae bacterium OttesenSCG-928-O06]|nr:bifunctional phosphoribosyl-AMP cyclohydrolase/phosphoribosyl-ATP diphosphatase HisIE [Ruminococcaceae bacterium OttesenSCG-928-O06]
MKNEAPDLKFDEKGLIPAIVQDYHTGQVLTLAYMNAESLAITLREKRTCFYSRSRKTLWRKGESSGNVQHVVDIVADCDADALVVRVIKEGPACHTGQESCFYTPVLEAEQGPGITLQGLYGLILERKAAPKEGSYTSYLFEKGREKILKKVGEEGAEVLIAATKKDDEETVFEIADLCYHILVLMAECGIAPGDVLAELAKRHVVDEKVKQETMQ